MAELFRTANLERLRELSQRPLLRRALRGWDVLSIGVGGMIGGGIFTTIGPGAKMAGPAILIAYLLAALASLFTALAYAEIAALVPISGSAYTYAYASLGKLMGWLVGFALTFEYAVSGAPMAQALSGAVQDFLHQTFGYDTPFWMQRSHLVLTGAWWNPLGWDFTHSQYDVIGAVFILLLSALLAIGIRETATTNNIANVLKMAALLVFVVAGATLIHPDRWLPFAPQGWGSLQPFSGGIGIGIIPAAAFVFFNYVGFDSATVVAEECVDPQRDLPFGIVGTLIVATVAYCAVAFVLVGAVPWQSIDETHALARAVEPLHNAFVNYAIVIGIIAGTITVAISAVLGQTRIFYVMSRDRMLPSFFARVNPKLRTPVRMTIGVGIFIAILTLIVPLDNLVNIVNIGAIFTYIAVCVGVIYLRRRYPDVPRPFRSPFVPLFPILGIASCAFLAVFGLDRTTWLWFLGSMLVGLGFFFLYGFRHADPDKITAEE